jgi:hypothetical protein
MTLTACFGEENVADNTTPQLEESVPNLGEGTTTSQTTKAPETTKVPETPKTSENTKAPEISKVPETTKDPEPTIIPDSSNLDYYEHEDGYYVIGIGSCTDSQIGIPSTHNGKPVIGIADNAFGGNEKITSIRLPESVKEIQMYAFAYCHNLKSINLENVETIYRCAFYQCASLERVESACTFIEDSVFEGCSSLVSVTLTGELELYGGAFAGCGKLKEVTLPAGIEYIDIRTFSDCTSLVDIYFLGTKEQWAAVERDDLEGEEAELGWNHNTGDYTVHCTDGYVMK